MRLGQLAKKTGIRPGEIVAFLKSQNLPVAEGSNNRLDEQQVALVVKHLAPLPIIQDELTDSEEKEETHSLPDENPAGEILSDNLPLTEPEVTIEEERIEVIRAPKVELSGLKVVGKIELPEIRKKEKAKGDEAAEESATPRKESKSRPFDKKQHGPRKNPIALQREREAREAEAKRKAEEERLKDQRKKHYESKKKLKTPIKSAKKSKIDSNSAESIPEHQPKSWLGRLWKWYRT